MDWIAYQNKTADEYEALAAQETNPQMKKLFQGMADRKRKEVEYEEQRAGSSEQAPTAPEAGTEFATQNTQNEYVPMDDYKTLDYL